MSAPTVMNGSEILYETGDDLDEDLLASYASKADKVVHFIVRRWLDVALVLTLIICVFSILDVRPSSLL